MPQTPPPIALRRLLVAGLALLLSLPPGCALFEIKAQQERLARIVRISGTVRTQVPTDKPMVVVLARQIGKDPEAASSWAIVDYIVRERPGGFAFGVGPGSYLVGAFEDLNSNLKYDSGEPVVRLRGGRIIHLDWGESDDDSHLVIRKGTGIEVEKPLDIAEAVDHSIERQQVVSLRELIARGEVAPLSDPRFDPPNGPRGLWRPADSLMDLRPGLYFLQKYRKDRIPVLFVHGISDTPRTFSSLIENLDRDRFQPWVWFYPSGLSLHGIAQAMVFVVTDLQLRLGFEKMGLVAHSMGGLVSRSFLLQLEEASETVQVPIFISISSPFGGSPAAEAGADDFRRLPPGTSLPASFLDMSPTSDFLTDLFYVSKEDDVVRPLPSGTRHHLIFGYRRKSTSFGPSSDGTIDLASSLRPEAEAQATTRFGVDASHVEILHEKLTIDRVEALLEAAFP